MLRYVALACLLMRAGSLLAADLVPDSVSPDGRYALAFVRPPWPPTDPPPTVWFVRLPRQTPVSTQLMPHDQPAMRMVHGKDGTYATYRDGRAGANQEDRNLMFDILTSVAQDKLQGKARGEGYRVVWSKDSRQASIMVAAHKFGHTSVYRLRRGRFYRHQDLDSYVPADQPAAASVLAPSADRPQPRRPRGAL